MSIISQDNTNEVAVLDCVQRFFSSHKVGNLLKKCNGTKEKGVPAISFLKYKLSNVFVGRSMYMQQRTGSFKEDFCKNTFYRFLNSTKTNWLRFTSSLASEIINDEIENLTDEKRANVFIVDNTLFNRTSYKKTELGSRVFDHVGMKFRKGFRLLTLGWSDGNTFIKYTSASVYLRELDRYNAVHGNHETLVKEIVDGWALKHAEKSTTGDRSWVSPIREFGRYLVNNGDMNAYAGIGGDLVDCKNAVGREKGCT